MLQKNQRQRWGVEKRHRDRDGGREKEGEGLGEKKGGLRFIAIGLLLVRSPRT